MEMKFELTNLIIVSHEKFIGYRDNSWFLGERMSRRSVIVARRYSPSDQGFKLTEMLLFI